MRVLLNGIATEIAEGTTLGALVDRLVRDRSRIAVERNRAIVPRATLDQAPVREGDEIELVTLVGGG